jgi:7-keto-8-aminopelargonate synthetase-like enzyme
MDLLEERINKLKDKYDKIWFMADGVYSMYGDFLPAQQLKTSWINTSSFISMLMMRTA